jgi:hypothetical protein
MKRKPYKKITVYNVVSHSVFINDNGSEDNFTIDKNDTYFDWSDSLDKKLYEYKNLVFSYEDLNDSDGIEKILWCAEIPVKMWNKYKKHDDISEYISNHVDYDFKILKSNYRDWQSFLSPEEYKEYQEEINA